MSYLPLSTNYDMKSKENFYNFSDLQQNPAVLTNENLFNKLRSDVVGATNLYTPVSAPQTYQTYDIPSDNIYNLYNSPNTSPIGDTITINDPMRVSERLSSIRDWETQKDFCKNRMTKYGLFDTYGRQANTNSVHWSDCPGETPSVAMDRDMYVQRMEFSSYAPYQLNIPKGLTL